MDAASELKYLGRVRSAIGTAACPCSMLSSTTSAAPSNELGDDYAVLALLTVFPDFSAASYTFFGNDSPDVSTDLRRFPLRLPLSQTRDGDHLDLELMGGHERTTEPLPIEGFAGQSMNSKWIGYGLGIGLIDRWRASLHGTFEPSLRTSEVRLSARMQGSIIRGDGVRGWMVALGLRAS